MAIDLTKKRVPPMGFVPLKERDGTPMVQENGEPCGARMHTPSSKIWQNANARRRRKALQRVREMGGKLEAGQETPEDIAEFLTAVTEEFIGVEVPLPEGKSGAKALVEAIFADPELGFIRDYLDEKSGDWGSFTFGSATS